MNSSDNWEVEWLVAALAPWTVSPHPNFRDDEVTGAAALALVTEMRDRSERHNVQPEGDSSSDWRDILVANPSRDELRPTPTLNTLEGSLPMVRAIDR